MPGLGDSMKMRIEFSVYYSFDLIFFVSGFLPHFERKPKKDAHLLIAAYFL